MQHILIIDDDPQMRTVIERMLAEPGFTTATAENGRRALEQAKKHRPDLVITDIFMPEMEGIETILKLRAAYGELPILAISAGWTADHPNLLNLVSKLGATETLEKPFRADELREAVGRCLSARGHHCEPGAR